jgi:glycosyltransferase involved in cell wall biosynthesis
VPLKVLQICHDYEGPFRDVCYQYNQAFREHDVTTVYVCGAASDRVAEDTGGDRVIFFEQPNRSMRGIKFRTIFRIARLFRENRFDVVVAHRYKPIYFAGVMSYFFPIKVLLAVAHEHDVYRRPTRKLFITFWCPEIICIGVSETVSRNIEQYCGPLSDDGRLFTLPHALDHSRITRLHERAEAREALGISGDAQCFGTIGRLVDKKDHEVLVAGFADYLEREGDERSCLVIIGSGPREQLLRQQCADLGIEQRVIFTGHLADAYKYLKALDVFVLTSGTMEAFGMVLLEAMLAKLPVISSDAPGPREVVAGTALLFATGDAGSLAEQLIVASRMSSEAREELAGSGFERLCNEYSMEAFRRRLHAIEPLKSLGFGEE